MFSLCFSLLMALQAHAVSTIPVTEKLENGLEIAWFEDERLPVIDFNWVVMNGTRSDPDGKSGLSELAAVLKGQAGRKRAEAIAAEFGVDASADFTVVHAHGLHGDWKDMLSILLDQALKHEFEPLALEFEKARVLEARANVFEGPESLAALAIQRLISDRTPYFYADFWKQSEFKELDAAALSSELKCRWLPRNALLVVLGRFSREEVRKQLIQDMARIPSGAGCDDRAVASRPERVGSLERSVKKGKRLPRGPGHVWYVDRPGLNQVQIRVARDLPPYPDPRRYAYNVLNTLFGDSFRSRLSLELRDKRGLTYAVGSELHYLKKQSWASVSTATSNEHAGEMLKSVLSQWKRLGNGSILETEIKDAKDTLIGSYPVIHATPQAIASRWVAGRVMQVPEKEQASYLERIEAVDRAAVLKVAKGFSRLDSAFIVVVGDWKKVRPVLEKAGFRSLQPFLDLQ